MNLGNLGNPGTGVFRALGRVLGIVGSWACLWLAIWLVAAIPAIVDPDGIDPGELWAMVRECGSMGLLFGIAIGIALSVGSNRQWRAGEVPLPRVVACGFLGCALVQIPYLGQGELGLEANVALSVWGALVTLVWGCAARVWTGWRAGFEPRS